MKKGNERKENEIDSRRWLFDRMLLDELTNQKIENRAMLSSAECVILSIP